MFDRDKAGDSDEWEETMNAESLSEMSEVSEGDDDGSSYMSVGDGQSSVEFNESFHSTFNNSLDLEPDVEPPRRGTRERRPPKTLVYDVLGAPGYKSRSKTVVRDDRQKR